MIQDLCIIMLTAGVVSLLFKLLKQPVVLGYIVAGLLVGPNVCGASWISDGESVELWGKIGVLFLLFAMGLEFSFKKLISMGSTALIAAATIIVGMMSVGFLTGRLIGWDAMNSLFIGGMLCMSSTTIVFKAIDDMKLSTHKFASVAMGILIVEDLFAVVFMVLLTSIAVNKKFEGMELLMEVGKLIGYLVLWFVMGIYLLPTFFRKFKSHLNDETLTIIAIGLCLGMVLLALQAGFSDALGAFVMGSILAETLEAERIERLVQPMKNVFGAVFFVSVGMMLNPDMVVMHCGPILLFTFIVIAGQITFATLGTILSGQTMKVALQTGFSLVQIGEFAFIIANFGQSKGVTDESLYPIVVAVSVITTFLTPYIMRMADPVENFLNAHMSNGIKQMLSDWYSRRNTVGENKLWQNYLKKAAITVGIYGIILVFEDLLGLQLLCPWIMEKSSLLHKWLSPDQAEIMGKVVCVLFILIINAPFLFNMATRHKKSDETRQLWHSGEYQKIYIISIRLLRVLIAIGFATYPIIHIFSFTSGLTIGFAIVIAFVIMGLILGSKKLRKHSRHLSYNFGQNLTARETQANRNRAIGQGIEDSLLSHDLHFADITLPPNSIYSGKTLRELNLRKQSGASVVSVIRDNIFTNIPGGEKHVYPNDRIVVAGTDEQIDRFRNMIENSVRKGDNQTERPRISLEHFTLGTDSPLIGKSIADSGIRDKAHCIVMGIERNGEYIMNPEPIIVFAENDTILVAGETESLRVFLNPSV